MKRFKNAADNAEKETALVPQRVNADMKDARDQATRIAADLVELDGDGNSAVVKSASASYRVIFSEIKRASDKGRAHYWVATRGSK
jgi:hypothetical protein